jgi:hypothetical protein
MGNTTPDIIFDTAGEELRETRRIFQFGEVGAVPTSRSKMMAEANHNKTDDV